MDMQEVYEIHNEILSKYRTNLYTQDDIAKEMNVPLEAVAFCTRHAGYYHTKAKRGERGVY